jgi:hypothetical protein
VNLFNSCKNDKFDVSDPTPAAPMSEIGLLHKFRKPLINFCLSVDPTVDGTVSSNPLIDFFHFERHYFTTGRHIVRHRSGLILITQAECIISTLIVDVLQNAESYVADGHSEESRAREALDPALFGDSVATPSRSSDEARH